MTMSDNNGSSGDAASRLEALIDDAVQHHLNTIRLPLRPTPLIPSMVGKPLLLDYSYGYASHRIWTSYTPDLRSGSFLLLQPNGVVDLYTTTPDGQNISSVTRIRTNDAQRLDSAVAVAKRKA